MPTHSSLRLFSTTLGFATILLTGNAADEILLPPSDVVITITVTDDEPTGAASAQLTALTGITVTPAQWTDIKDCTSGMRAQFFAGLQRLETRALAQFSELTARRAALTSPGAIATLDRALQDLRNAQFFLTLMGQSLSRATAQTWDERKAKVGLAWKKTQAAYAKGNPDPLVT